MDDSNNTASLSVDVEKVVAGKNPALAGRIPKFVFNYLKRLIHQDEINALLEKNGGYEGVEFASHILGDMGITYNVHYSSPIDRNGRYIFVSNHPLGGLDGMVLIACLGKEFGNVRFMVNDLLMYLSPFRNVFVPINKYGRMSPGNAAAIQDTFMSDAQILYFPAGLCSRKINGRITDLEWKKTFVTKAVESRRDIVPMFFSGCNSARFYRIANLRKKLGIKFNAEMILLPDEMFRQRNTSFDLYIGEPIPHGSLTAEHTHKGWCEIIRNKCYDTHNKADRP
ncbi:MAG TPA: 1-acyl-sn-glycerol-3-phosphate acyltransferase [Candidatus Coprenecus stercoripullorum]|nr:1-acyl-sn-glycerol-3-phosphate acyltransferase [Candidatus Coprenecus stercoripullorum]